MSRPPLPRALAFGLALVCAGSAHFCQREIDPSRRAQALEAQRDTVPSGPVLQVASSGFHVLVADVLWLRTVLAFGEMYEKGTLDDGRAGDWLGGAVLATSELDPDWRTPFQWGGLMLEVANEQDAARELYRLGVKTHPQEYRFWFAWGMLEYFHYEDPQAASLALSKAAECPGAPPWFAEAALAYGAERDTEEAAIHYLNAQLEATSDPELRANIEDRIHRLDHQRLVAQIGEVRRDLEQSLGPMPSIAALERAAGRPLPADPMGAGWMVDVDGTIRSRVIAEELAEKDRMSARRMLINPSNRPVPGTE